MCPGLQEDLVRDLRAADIKTGRCVCVCVLRIRHNSEQTNLRFVFTVEDLVSSDLEELAQKCSVSYKVKSPSSQQ